VAIRRHIALDPDTSTTINLVTGMGEPATLPALVEKYRDRRSGDRVFDLAWTHSKCLRQLNATGRPTRSSTAPGRLGLYATKRCAPTRASRKNRRGQSGSGLRHFGDLPIGLLQVGDAQIELVVNSFSHAYWRLKGLAVDW